VHAGPETNSPMFAQSKHVLIVGESGSGKSTLTNALVNNSVSPQHLTKPAETGNSGHRVTVRCEDYENLHHNLVVTDTADAWQLAHFLVAAEFPYSHIILCLRETRIHMETILILRVLSQIFGSQLPKNMLICLQCVDESAARNMWLQFPLLRNFVDRRRAQIVTGTLRFHKNSRRDRPLLRQSRNKLLHEIQAVLNRQSQPRPLHAQCLSFESIPDCTLWEYFSKHRELCECCFRTYVSGDCPVCTLSGAIFAHCTCTGCSDVQS